MKKLKKAIALILCLALLAFCSNSALAVNVYKNIYGGSTYTVATGNRTSDYIVVTIHSNSNFYGTTEGINFRAYLGTDKYSNAMTFRSGDVPGYKQRDYFGTAQGMLMAKSNLTTSSSSVYVTFAGVVSF